MILVVRYTGKSFNVESCSAAVFAKDQSEGAIPFINHLLCYLHKYQVFLARLYKVQVELL